MKSKSSGQAFVEFLLSLFVLIPLIIGLTYIIQTQWKRIQCIHLVFDKTHDRLFQKPGAQLSLLEYDESETHVTGTLHCGDLKESLSLPKLEKIKW